MKFNPLTGRLYTDDMQLLKRLHCPFGQSWNQLSATDDHAVRRCEICEHIVTDTAPMSDPAMLALVAAHPDACLKVQLEQENLTVIYDDE